jgi:hypothetical protein
MGRARRVFLTACLSLGLTIASAMPVPVFALGETQVTLSCSDGTSTDLTVDGATLAGLKNAVEAMALYPAGLTCSLTEALSTAFVPAARAASGPQSYVVGGGQWSYCNDNVNVINVAINARIRADGTFEGTINQEIPPAHGGCLGEGALRTDVDCALILGTPNRALVASRTTKARGFYSYALEGTYFWWRFVDNGNPTPGVTPGPDTRQGHYPGTSSCPTDAFFATAPESVPFPLLRGNFVVRINS